MNVDSCKRLYQAKIMVNPQNICFIPGKNLNETNQIMSMNIYDGSQL